MKTILLWLAMVLILSVYPVQTEVPAAHADKLLHAIIYAITTLLFYSTLKGRPYALLLSVLLAAGYGFLMEVIQGFTPHRGFSIYDALANLAGASAAALYLRSGRSSRKAG